jgi:hypothetical protein
MLVGALRVAWVSSIAAASASAPPAHCELHEANKVVHRWEGSCPLLGQPSKLRLKPTKAITSGRWRRDADPRAVWAGDITGQDSSTDDVELEAYAPSATGVLRTEDGWYAISGYRATPTLLAFDVDTSATVPPNDLDREIVRRADALLSSVDVWNRADNRRCPVSEKTWSIYCALQRASELAACGAHHRRPAMETVRVAIEERTVGRNYGHRLMGYNNDTTTTLSDVRSVFAEALKRIPGGPDSPLPPPPTCPPPQPAPITAAEIGIVDRARDILKTPATWNKADGQECPADQKTLGIFCAMKRASEETIGEWNEVGPAMREARQLVDSLAKKHYNARLVDYNNDPDVSFADLQTFFRILHERLAKRLTPG